MPTHIPCCAAPPSDSCLLMLPGEPSAAGREGCDGGGGGGDDGDGDGVCLGSGISAIGGHVCPPSDPFAAVVAPPSPLLLLDSPFFGRGTHESLGTMVNRRSCSDHGMSASTVSISRLKGGAAAARGVARLTPGAYLPSLSSVASLHSTAIDPAPLAARRRRCHRCRYGPIRGGGHWEVTGGRRAPPRWAAVRRSRMSDDATGTERTWGPSRRQTNISYPL